MIIYNYVFWIQAACLTFALVSFPLYLFVIITLVVYRKKEQLFKNSFFYLWVSLGVTDLIHTIVFWITGKLPLMGFFTSWYLTAGRTVAKVFMYVTYATHYVQVFGIILLSINRLTALVYPTTYETIWTKPWLIPSSLAGSCLVGLVMSAPVLFMEMDWIRPDNESKVAMTFLSVDSMALYMFWVGVLLAIVATSTVCVYIYMFYVVQKKTAEQRKAMKTQIKLAMCGFLVALFLAFLSVCLCLFSFSEDVILFGDNAIFFLISCDLNTFCNGYLLLCTSKVVREYVVELAGRIFCCRLHSMKHKVKDSFVSHSSKVKKISIPS